MPRNRSREVRPKGICAECCRPISLVADGSVRGHPRMGQQTEQAWRPWCEGSRLAPIALIVDGIVRPNR